MPTDDLFSATPPANLAKSEVSSSASPSGNGNAPLAARMRPRSLDEYFGQSHILGPGQLLRRAIEADRIQSLIFYGPPGTGKTSLARIIAARTRNKFERLSGVESNVADMRRVLAAAAHRLENTGLSTILFIDEIHRFNKAQQDVLLPDVESGVIRLIGATTHNPFFFVNSPLVSRSQIFELRPLTELELFGLLQSALQDPERGLGRTPVKAEEVALRHLARIADGDARKALNALEIAVLTTPPGADGVVSLNLSTAEQSIQKKAIVYDGDGDAHYDTISAFIKSMRGSDPDATLYWLAKMIHAGEDPRWARGTAGFGSGERRSSSRRVCRVARSPDPNRRGGVVHRDGPKKQYQRSSDRRCARRCSLWPNASGSRTPSRRTLPRRKATGPWRRVSIRARSPRTFRCARLSGGVPTLLRADRARSGACHQGSFSPVALAIAWQNGETGPAAETWLLENVSPAFSSFARRSGV